jgi:hypothetical protein
MFCDLVNTAVFVELDCPELRDSMDLVSLPIDGVTSTLAVDAPAGAWPPLAILKLTVAVALQAVLHASP